MRDSSSLFQSIVWMFGAMVSFTLMAISGRELYSALDTFEIMTYRSLVGVLIVLFVVFYNRSLKEISLKKIKLHFIRNIFHL